MTTGILKDPAGAAAATATGEGQLWGLLAGFGDIKQFVAAVDQTREAGFTKWDACSPFPVHGLERAMGLRRTPLPWVVLAGGVTGCGGAILMQWWMNAVDYPLLISGKPLWSIPANIPITFELTVLLSALCAFFGMFAFNGLPQLYHPVFKSEQFRRVTRDRFFIIVEAADPRFDHQRTRAFLAGLPGAQVEELED